jgi:hypothetical protein
MRHFVPAERHHVAPRAGHVHPMLEATPDINRGEQRLAAEIAIARLNGEKVPFDAALRARSILETLAKG